jgi:hypothetical protein
MSRRIVAYIKDSDARKYKIEEVKISTGFLSSEYWYHVLYNDGTLKYKDFKSKSSAIRYLEEHVGNCKEY